MSPRRPLLRAAAALLLPVVLGAALGCSSTDEVDDGPAGAPVKLTPEALDAMADELAVDLISFPHLPRAADGARLAVTVGSLTNRTSKFVDTDELARRLRVAFASSGRFRIVEPEDLPEGSGVERVIHAARGAGAELFVAGDISEEITGAQRRWSFSLVATHIAGDAEAQEVVWMNSERHPRP